MIYSLRRVVVYVLLIRSFVASYIVILYFVYFCTTLYITKKNQRDCSRVSFALLMNNVCRVFHVLCHIVEL